MVAELDKATPPSTSCTRDTQHHEKGLAIEQKNNKLFNLRSKISTAKHKEGKINETTEINNNYKI